MSRRESGPRKDEATGTWWFVTDGPPGPSGERRQLRRRGFDTKRAAQEELDKLRVKVSERAYVAPKRQTFSQFVDDEWLPAVRAYLEGSSLSSYRRMLRLHITPYIGGVQLQSLDAGHLNRLYGELLASGRKDGVAGGLSHRTVRYTHTLVHHVLKDAVKWGRLPRNVADAADPPSAAQAKAKDMTVWTSDELAHFLEVTRRQRVWPVWFFLATTGCRRQEALGLRWSDVHLDTAKASIRQVVTIVNDQEARLKPAPKTKKSERLLELDERTVAVLRTWKAKQAQERLAFGAGYSDLDLVFTKPDGSLIHPKRLTQEFEHNIKRHSLSPLSVHGLRHTWATLALEAGVDITIVSRQLGHSSIAITADIYAHVTPRMLAGAAEKVAGLIFGGGA